MKTSLFFAYFSGAFCYLHSWVYAQVSDYIPNQVYIIQK